MAKNIERNIIKTIKTKKAVLFIDTSRNGLSTFTYKLSNAPLIYQFVMIDYCLLTEVNKMKIYILKEEYDQLITNTKKQVNALE